MEIILLLIGALIGWAITHIYSNKSSSEQTKLFNKISVEVREIILTDARSQLSIPELNSALLEKTMDLKKIWFISI